MGQEECLQQEATSGAGCLDIFCPFCSSEKFVKRGTRKKKLETIQLYLCKECNRTFTPGAVKGKHYPLPIILDAISLYHLGYSLEQAADIVNKTSRSRYYPNLSAYSPFPKEQGDIANNKEATSGAGCSAAGSSGTGCSAAALANWLRQFEKLCAYKRMRRFGLKMYKPEQVIVSATLAHRQLYRFRYHQAKIRLIIEEDFKHSRFWPLKEFLDLVPAECPHQYFQEGLRASEAPMIFSKANMIVRSKQNYATRLAEFVLQSVKESKERHDALQRFMLANDSVTVATEVPVYIRKEDLAHMRTQLGFEMYYKKDRRKTNKELEAIPVEDLPKLITGHIDFLQVRNGQVHIIDYKANAHKERPIEQLTLYALALSRLTGLRVYNFKCAWFDEKNYYEFFPLHVVYKRKKGRRKKVTTKEGVYRINERSDKIENLRPLVK